MKLVPLGLDADVCWKEGRNIAKAGAAATWFLKPYCILAVCNPGDNQPRMAGVSGFLKHQIGALACTAKKQA
jgi:hypothetical protein